MILLRQKLLVMLMIIFTMLFLWHSQKSMQKQDTRFGWLDIMIVWILLLEVRLYKCELLRFLFAFIKFKLNEQVYKPYVRICMM